MRYLLTTAAIILSCCSGRGQMVVDLSKTELKPLGDGMAQTVVNGMVYSPIKFVKVTAGTPFFKEEWMKATLVLDGGKAYSNVPTRLNLMDNEVNYRDAAGQEMIATSPIKFIIFTDSITGAKYEFILGDQLANVDKTLTKTWFQVLVNDKVSLCLQMKKSIHETISYGSATTEQDIPTIDFYYVQINGTFIRFRWDDWQQIFGSKKDQMSQFIRTNHLKGKTSDDYVKLVRYYNTL